MVCNKYLCCSPMFLLCNKMFFFVFYVTSGSLPKDESNKFLTL